MISGWANTQAVAEVSCPRCGALVSESCKTPKGRKADVHGERGKAYLEKIGRAEWMHRHSVRNKDYSHD